MSKIVVQLPREKECVGSVRFALSKQQVKEMVDAGNPPAVTNIYVSRSVPEIKTAKHVSVTIEV